MPISQVTDQSTGTAANPIQQIADYGPEQDAMQTINNNFAAVVAKLNEIVDAINDLLNP